MAQGYPRRTHERARPLVANFRDQLSPKHGWEREHVVDDRYIKCQIFPWTRLWAFAPFPLSRESAPKFVRGCLLPSGLYGKLASASPRSRPMIAKPRYCAPCTILVGGVLKKDVGGKVSPRSLPPLGRRRTKRETAPLPSFQAAAMFVVTSRWFKAPRSKEIDYARQNAAQFVLASRKATTVAVGRTVREREG